MIALEGSAARLWAEASQTAPYDPLESIGAEAGVELRDNVATVVADADYTLSVKVSAWAQPAFMLLAVCEGVIAVVDAVSPTYLKPGVLRPPPVFTLPQPALPAVFLTFDPVSFPSSVLEGAKFSVKVTLPSAGLPESLTLQGNRYSPSAAKRSHC
jgi:hypothetical protein